MASTGGVNNDGASAKEHTVMLDATIENEQQQQLQQRHSPSSLDAVCAASVAVSASNASAVVACAELSPVASSMQISKNDRQLAMPHVCLFVCLIVAKYIIKSIYNDDNEMLRVLMCPRSFVSLQTATLNSTLLLFLSLFLFI